MTGEAVTVATANHEADAAADRLGALFDAHHQRLHRLARRLSRSVDEARDLVQDTFLRAARAPGSVPAGATEEEAWLVRVLINLSRDRWRQNTTRARLDQSPRLMPAEEIVDPEAALVARAISSPCSATCRRARPRRARVIASPLHHARVRRGAAGRSRSSIP